MDQTARLAEQVNRGLLRPTQPFGQRYVYLATPKGWRLACDVLNSDQIPYPASSVNIRTFVHDRYLLTSRVQLEQTSEIEKWISDKMLSEGANRDFGVSQKQIPDAIIFQNSGLKYALEVEISTKARQRYRDKIRNYVFVMRSRVNDSSMFKKVKFICLREPVFKILKYETSLYGNLFEVEFVRIPNLLAASAS